MTAGRWVRVGDAAKWVKGHGRQVELDGATIAVFWDGAAWTAVDDACPHMGASLADGRLYGNELQCSWHDWRFNRETGQCPLREWARVRVYPVLHRRWRRLDRAAGAAAREGRGRAMTTRNG